MNNYEFLDTTLFLGALLFAAGYLGAMVERRRWLRRLDAALEDRQDEQDGQDDGEGLGRGRNGRNGRGGQDEQDGQDGGKGLGRGLRGLGGRRER